MTFQIPGGVSAQAERRLWQSGILCWDDLRHHCPRVLSKARRDRLLSAIDQLESAITWESPASLLAVDHPVWRLRLYPLLAQQAVYLDIETTGLALCDPPTTAAIYYRKKLQLFVANVNLHELPSSIPTQGVLVTFNGRRFDLPRLKYHLHWCFELPHLDLGPIMRACGFAGGLKTCLKRLGIPRPPHLPQQGADAPLLWQEYLRGDARALTQLLAYNALDAILLESLWAVAYNRSLERWPLFRPARVPTTPDINKTIEEMVELCRGHQATTKSWRIT